MLNCTSYSAFIVQIEVILLCKLRLFRCASWGFLFPHHSWLSLLDNSRKTSPRVCHVEEFIYLSVAKKKGASQTYDTPSSLYKSLSISKVIHVYILCIVLFLLAQANRMAHVSHFWNWVYYVFQEHAHAKNHTWKHNCGESHCKNSHHNY